VSRAHLLLVGDGPMRPSLTQRAVALELTNQVSFVGFLQGDELRQAYLASDIFVLPTRGHEGWAVVVQEAMAAGLAVVVSDRVGAAADLIQDGHNGLIVPADDVHRLAQCLLRLCEQHELRAKLGLYGQGRVVATGAAPAARKLLDYLDSVKQTCGTGTQSPVAPTQTRTSQSVPTEIA